MRALKIAGGVLGGLLVVVVLVVGAVALGGTGVLRWAIEHPVSGIAGRQIRVDGPLSVRWGRPTRIVAENVHIANAGWGSRPDMFVAQRLELDIFPATLFARRYHLPLVSLDRALLLIETGRHGERNWNFAFRLPTPDDRSHFPDIDRVILRDATFIFRNGASGAETNIAATRLDLGATDPAGPVKLGAEGTFQRLPVRLAGTLGPPAALRDAATPYPIDLEGRLGDGSLAVHGSLAQPFELAGMDVGLSLSGRNLQGIGEALGLPLPPLPAFRANGRLRGGRDDWAIELSSLQLGRSDLAGELDIGTRGKAPYLRADLTSNLIDVADFIGFFGENPPTSAARSAPAARGGGEDLVIPATPIATKELLGIDADLTLAVDANRFAATIGPPLDKLSAALHLKDGVLRLLQPLSFGLAGGTTVIGMTLGPGPERPELAFDLDIRRVDLRRVATSAQLPEAFKDTRGVVGGFIHFRSTGRSLRDFLGRMYGEAGAFAADGQLNGMLQKITTPDVLQAVGLAGAGGRPVPVNCLVSRFDIKDGVATATTLLLDTDDLTLIGSGNFNFAAETMYVDLTPYRKDFDPLALNSAIELRGTFAHPDIGISKTTIPRRTGTEIGRALQPPPAALLALVDAELGADNGCGRAFKAQPAEPAVGTSGKPPDQR